MAATTTHIQVTHYVPLTTSPLFAAGAQTLLGSPDVGAQSTWHSATTDVRSIEHLAASADGLVAVVVDLTLPTSLVEELCSLEPTQRLFLVGIAHAPQPVRLLAAAQAGFHVVALSTDSGESLREAFAAAQGGDTPSLSQDVAKALEEHPAVILPARVAETVRVLDEGITRAETAGRLQPPVSSCTVSTYVERAFNLYSASGRPVSSIVGLLREARLDGYLPCVASELQCRSV